MRILITGGAGFVGSQLARLWKTAMPNAQIVAFDNLRRRGGELNLADFARLGIEFVHGDIRSPGDLEGIPGNFDLLLEASAEPSVHAGGSGSPDYVIQTNLVGTVNCLELARRRCGAVSFLSTSRVYSIPALRALPLKEQPTRFVATPVGIAEDFPTTGFRSFYGSTKLASELLIQEYAQSYGMKAMINRCGVIAGPGQFGKVDQGVFTLWVAAHWFGKPLRYTGFGGTGKQVRDLLAPRDLFRLLRSQLDSRDAWNGEVFNVGGGEAVSTSLQEWTEHARQATGREIPISANTDTAAVDIPYYVSDCARARQRFGWQPEVTPAMIAREIASWIRENETQLRPILCP